MNPLDVRELTAYEFQLLQRRREERSKRKIREGLRKGRKDAVSLMLPLYEKVTTH